MNKVVLPERKDLEVNLFVTLGISLAFTVAIYIVLLPVRTFYIGQLLYSRGWTQPVVILLSGLVASFTIIKFIKILLEFAKLKDNWIPRNVFLENPSHRQVAELQRNLATKKQLLAIRCARILAAYMVAGNREAAAEVAMDDASSCIAASETSYSAPRVMVWAIPLFGFIGTVVGISAAVDGFSKFLQGAEEIDQIKQGIGAVTTGLAIAFDTTLLALVLSVVVMIPLVLVERWESRLLLAIDTYINDELLSRLSHEKETLDREVIRQTITQILDSRLPSPDALVKPAQIYAESAALERVAAELQAINNKLVEELRISNAASAKNLAERSQQLAEVLEKTAKTFATTVAALEDSPSQLGEIIQLQQMLAKTLHSLEETSDLRNVLLAVRETLAEMRPILEQLAQPRRITLIEDKSE